MNIFTEIGQDLGLIPKPRKKRRMSKAARLRKLRKDALKQGKKLVSRNARMYSKTKTRRSRSRRRSRR